MRLARLQTFQLRTEHLRLLPQLLPLKIELLQAIGDTLEFRADLDPLIAVRPLFRLWLFHSGLPPSASNAESSRTVLVVERNQVGRPTPSALGRAIPDQNLERVVESAAG